MISYQYLTNSKHKKLLKDKANHLLNMYLDTGIVCRPSTKEKILLTLTNIMFNACRLKTVPDKTLVICLRDEFFTEGLCINGHKTPIPFSLGMFKLATKFLQQIGYISIKLGGDFKYHEVINKDGEIKMIVDGRNSSKMEVHDSFINFLADLEVKPDFKTFNSLVLRDEEKKDKTFSMTIHLKQQKQMLLAYNEMLSGVKFTDKDGKIINDPFLRRIYNVDFEHGGRFYCDRGVIQTMSQEDRKLVKINDEPVNDIDIVAMHPAIVFTQLECKMPKDPYDFPIICKFDEKAVEDFKNKFNIESYDPIRNIRKLIMLIAFNTSRESLPFVVADKLGKDKFLQVSKDPLVQREARFVGVSSVKVMEAIDSMMELHSDISIAFGKDLSLQYKDSLFMYRVLTYCLQESLPVIPIHDSVLCQQRSKERVAEIMRESFKDVFGTDENFYLKIK